MSPRPIPREHSARCERVYGVEVYGIVHGGRLRMGLTWVPSPADGVDEAGVDALVAQMAWVLATLAGADPATVVPAEIGAPGTGSRPRPAALPAPARPGAEDGRPVTVPVTPQQHGLLLDALAHRGTGRYVEQLFWRWHGPLDTDRFTAAWQSVFDRETVLRAAFDWEAEPCLVLHEHVRAEVVRHPAGSVDFEELRERDRLRGFDLRGPGLLRVNVLDEADPGDGGPERARILLTFHHVLLDGWSVSVLLQEFYRAYLAGRSAAGRRTAPRRPRLRALAGRAGHRAAREFWSSAVPDATPLVRPAVPGPATGLAGSGRAEVRIAAAQADRLRSWAASSAATESTALQAVWALLLYRAGVTSGSAPVGFGVTVSGRGIPLDSVERLPGLLMNSLPMTVRVDPDAAVTRLLTELRDHALDMAAYEWVSTGQIHQWSGRRPDEKLVESLIVFENYPRGSDDLRTALAAQGIEVELPDAAGSQTAFPVTLLAYRDVDGSLVLAAVHDRARLADEEAARLVGQCARLLRELPDLAGRCGDRDRRAGRPRRRPAGADGGRAPAGRRRRRRPRLARRPRGRPGQGGLADGVRHRRRRPRHPLLRRRRALPARRAPAARAGPAHRADPAPGRPARPPPRRPAGRAAGRTGARGRHGRGRLRPRPAAAGRPPRRRHALPRPPARRPGRLLRAARPRVHRPARPRRHPRPPDRGPRAGVPVRGAARRTVRGGAAPRPGAGGAHRAGRLLGRRRPRLRDGPPDRRRRAADRRWW
ncbi:condensation domain-containing protein [Streptomyces albogriseolus]|nr:condensation domain-containing protein [Streptomyces albogriseolus]